MALGAYMAAVLTTQVDVTSGQPTEQRQANGAAYVTIVPGSAQTAMNATTTAYAASLLAKASAGTLYYISGYNSNASAQFIQVHDAAALPADGAVPKLIMRVAATSNFAFISGSLGRYFANGIVVCNSSTGPTKTIGAADCWFDLQYA